MKANLTMLLCVLIFSVSLLAQTAVPKPDSSNYKTWEDYNEALMDWKIQQSKLPKTEPKCTTLQSCKAALKAEVEANQLLTSQLQAAKQESAAKDDSLKDRADIAKKYEDALAVLIVLDKELRGVPTSDEESAKLKSVPAGKVLELGVSIEKSQQELSSFATKVKEHDEMAVNKYNALLSDYQDYVTRVGQQFAAIGRQQRINNALAIYQALPKYQAPQTIQLNVADCSKTPALCVH